MKFLNEKATKTFCDLIDMMGDQQHLKIENAPFMPLTIEVMSDQITTPWGTGKFYSLCHYYEQNGDLMQDPEMSFAVIDNDVTGEGHESTVVIVPFMYQQANVGVYQESIVFDKGTIHTYSQRMYEDHLEFANIWLSNIKQQGYLKIAVQRNTDDHE